MSTERRTILNGRYALDIQHAGIGSPSIAIVDTAAHDAACVYIYANDENLGQAVVKGTAIAALMNAGLSEDQACERWN